MKSEDLKQRLKVKKASSTNFKHNPKGETLEDKLASLRPFFFYLIPIGDQSTLSCFCADVFFCCCDVHTIIMPLMGKKHIQLHTEGIRHEQAFIITFP